MALWCQLAASAATSGRGSPFPSITPQPGPAAVVPRLGSEDYGTLSVESRVERLEEVVRILTNSKQIEPCECYVVDLGLGGDT